MRPHELEARVHGILDRVERGQPVEDSTVELKTEWPDPTRGKPARQIAAHANAARGDQILWLIGVDERGHRVVSADENELANWWPAVRRGFEGTAPTLDMNLAVSRGPATVVALLFGTGRAPYVVRVAEARVDFEVPWRSANGTRSARREELLRLLIPPLRTPSIEVLRAQAHVDQKECVRLSAKLYVVPPDPLWFPFHRCSAAIRANGLVLRSFTMTMRPDNSIARMQSATVRASSSEVGIEGPGSVWLDAEVALDDHLSTDAPVLEVELNLGTHVEGESVGVAFALRLRSTGTWVLDSEPT